ncbi:sugar transferase [Phenylobacterium aquaticum]|uniref:sugar transferase n=1 Tax=Phenylobacterium aquaticum TaxID=1763816 RepID=UPI001F5CEEE0|nr:sugar transferase [Phenylobacterium aquaticum]
MLIATVVLVFVTPLMLAVAIGIKLQDGGPILFGHQRIGFGGRSFRCWKFRSMVVDAESRLQALLVKDPAAKAEWEADHKLRMDPRVTAFGRFLRVSSLDELPQLLNVIAGEMSLVGPRPIVSAEVARYGRWFKAYTSVRPGITGLWQISGRNDVSYRQRVAMDVLFARKRSVGQYIRILLGTVPAVLSRSGSY